MSSANLKSEEHHPAPAFGLGERWRWYSQTVKQRFRLYVHGPRHREWPTIQRSRAMNHQSGIDIDSCLPTHSRQ